MDLKSIQSAWNRYAEIDPFFEILSYREKKNFKWEEDDFFQTGVDEVNRVLKQVESLGSQVSKVKAMDFGCGVGRLSFALADHFDEVHCIDISSTMIRLAEKHNRHGQKCKFHINDSSDLKVFGDRTFDFIYTSRVLQHMSPEYSTRYIKEFLRVLKTGGTLVFQLPTREISHLSKISDSLKERDFKRLVFYLVPKPIIDLYLLIRKGRKRPKVEMHGIKKEAIVDLIESNGGALLDASQNDAAGSDWISMQYIVRRK